MSGHDGVAGGPLGPHSEGFGQHLELLGFGVVQAEEQRRLFEQLSRWLDAEAVGVEELTGKELEEFLAERRRGGARRLLTLRGLGPTLDYLRSVGFVPAAAGPVPVDGADALVERYRGFLVGQRGLVAAVVGAYVREAAGFLAAVAPSGEVGVAALTTADVSEFMAGAAVRRSRGSVANLVPALRSFLRFVHLGAITGRDLSRAVPTLARRCDLRLPRVLSPGEVARLVNSCDRRRLIGRRDRAVLVVLSRLGLRAGEVAALGLDDIDWRAGEVVVHGKGPRDEVLPLPADVGEAIADYLTRGRPSTPSRAVFVRAVAPRVALSPAGVTWVVYAACERAGLPRVGAHCLRHTAASHMLAAGSSLAEVGQVLRHRRAATTAVYANPRVLQQTSAKTAVAC